MPRQNKKLLRKGRGSLFIVKKKNRMAVDPCLGRVNPALVGRKRAGVTSKIIINALIKYKNFKSRDCFFFLIRNKVIYIKICF
jgi:hypothetical protein